MRDMEDSIIRYKPIGIIRSGHVEVALTPMQPVYARGCQGRVEMFQEFEDGLTGLEGFSHIYLIYHFNKAGPVQLNSKPLPHGVEVGIFSTRAPLRPNAVGLSIVELLRREKNILFLDGVDILDGTPLLDIKPYYYTGWRDRVPRFRARQAGDRQRRFEVSNKVPKGKSENLA